MELQQYNARVDGGEVLLEFYEISPPFAYALIVRRRDGGIEYRLLEPPLTPEDIRGSRQDQEESSAVVCGAAR